MKNSFYNKITTKNKMKGKSLINYYHCYEIRCAKLQVDKFFGDNESLLETFQTLNFDSGRKYFYNYNI